MSLSQTSPNRWAVDHVDLSLYPVSREIMKNLTYLMIISAYLNYLFNLRPLFRVHFNPFCSISSWLSRKSLKWTWHIQCISWTSVSCCKIWHSCCAIFYWNKFSCWTFIYLSEVCLKSCGLYWTGNTPVQINNPISPKRALIATTHALHSPQEPFSAGRAMQDLNRAVYISGLPWIKKWFPPFSAGSVAMSCCRLWLPGDCYQFTTTLMQFV